MDEKSIRSLMKGLGGDAELRETHISWVILAGDSAYKIKKPVKFSFLDFSTLDRRKACCEDEVRLNQRLSPEIYLGMVGICEASPGSFGIGDVGKAVDYAVRMKRLDEGRMMSRLLETNGVGTDTAKELGRIVSDFHSRVEVLKAGYNSPEMIGAQIADLGNFREAIDKAAGMGKAVDTVLQRSAGFIERNIRLLRERQAKGMVRECHGDLHSGNIFIDGGVRIIDCIEFSRDFRCIDVASEVAFMAMDFDAHGRADLAAAFVEEYQSRTKDAGIKELLPFYKCYRANVRAKIAAIDFMNGGGEKASGRIKKYMILAENYAGLL